MRGTVADVTRAMYPRAVSSAKQRRMPRAFAPAAEGFEPCLAGLNIAVHVQRLSTAIIRSFRTRPCRQYDYVLERRATAGRAETKASEMSSQAVNARRGSPELSHALELVVGLASGAAGRGRTPADLHPPRPGLGPG